MLFVFPVPFIFADLRIIFPANGFQTFEIDFSEQTWYNLYHILTEYFS